VSTAQSGIEVISVETDEVEVFIGPRRISGLVSNTTELEVEARAARVYRKPAQAARVLDVVSVEAESVDSTVGPRAQTALIFNFALGEGEQA
jgi:hypothetical protein